MTTPVSSLVVGDRVVSRCEDAPLETEYALFLPEEVLLAGQAGAGIREQGYLTTAALARERLHAAGVTPDLSEEALAALGPERVRSLAIARSVRRVAERLGPYEAFEGGTYDAAAQVYDGVWLDLRALARACGFSRAGRLLQALHLVLVLDEVDDDVPVRLLTAGVTREGRPGQRTWRRVSLEDARLLPVALQAIARSAPSLGAEHRDEAEVREALLHNLRARSTAAKQSQPRLYALAELLAGTRRLEPSPSEPRLEEELRAHVEMLRGEQHLRAVAQFLSAMSTGSTSLPERAVLAARAWLAAGETAWARYFARMIVEDRAASDDVRLVALEILDSTTKTNESMAPPPTTSAEPPRPEKPPVVVVRAAPPGASLPPSEPIERPPPPAPSTAPTPRAFVPRVEIVESLPLPEGATDDMLPSGAVPRDPLSVRIAMTRLARALGRAYRLSYGKTLKTDPLAIEAMQHHLRRRWSASTSDADSVRRLEPELTRHGALLSEILARSLGAAWEDVSSDQMGRWSMWVPPGVRVWPIGRIYRFFSQGHREGDLLAFYFDLESGSRRPIS